MAWRQSIKRNIVANYGANIWMAAISLVCVPFYLRFLGIEAYGLIGVLGILQALSSLFDLGITTTINREMARLSLRETSAYEAATVARTLEVVYWVIAVLLGVTIVLLSPVLRDHWIVAQNLSPDAVKSALVLIGLVLMSQWPFSFYAGGVQGLQRQVTLSSVNVSIATLRGGGAILILWLVSPTIQAFLIWQVAINTIATFLVATILWRNIPRSSQTPKFQTAQLRRVFRFSTAVSTVSILGLILLQSDKVVLSKLLSLEDFGYYTLAVTITGSLLMLVNPVYSAVFPRMTQLVAANDQMGLVDVYHKGSATMAVVLLSATAVLTLFSQPLLLVWTGDMETATRTGWLVAWLAIGTSMYGLAHTPWAVQLAHGWTRLGLYLNSFGVVFFVPLLIVLALKYGSIGAAIAWAVFNGIYLTIGQAVMHRRLLKGELRRWYLNDVGWVALVAFAVAGTARFIMPADLPRVWLLLFLLGVSACTLGVTALMTPVVRIGILNEWSRRRVILVGSGADTRTRPGPTK